MSNSSRAGLANNAMIAHRTGTPINITGSANALAGLNITPSARKRVSVPAVAGQLLRAATESAHRPHIGTGANHAIRTNQTASRLPVILPMITAKAIPIAPPHPLIAAALPRVPKSRHRSIALCLRPSLFWRRRARHFGCAFLINVERVADSHRRRRFSIGCDSVNSAVAAGVAGRKQQAGHKRYRAHRSPLVRRATKHWGPAFRQGPPLRTGEIAHRRLVARSRIYRDRAAAARVRPSAPAAPPSPRCCIPACCSRGTAAQAHRTPPAATRAADRARNACTGARRPHDRA